MSKKDNIVENLDTFEGIIIDTREPIEKFNTAYFDFALHAKSSEEVPSCKLHALPYGDYLICTKNYRLLIERKEFHDYCRSLGDNLEERFNHMRIENDLTMLLVEGNPEMMDQNAVYRRDNHRQYLQRAASFKTYKNFQLRQQLNGSMFAQTIDYKDTVFTIFSYYHFFRDLPIADTKYIHKPWERWFSLAPFVGKRLTRKLTLKYDSCYDALVNIEDWATEKIMKDIKTNWRIGD
jgi:hypothetical protein